MFNTKGEILGRYDAGGVRILTWVATAFAALVLSRKRRADLGDGEC